MSFNFLFKDVSFGGNRKVPFVYVLWFTLALIAVLAELLHHSINNYLIFKNVFWHVLHQKNLYLYYADEYQDHNLYGPIFSFIIAPFAILPDWLGVILWVMFNAFVLFVAIRQLPLSEKAIKTVFLISAIDFMTAGHNVQFNAIVAALIIFSYTFVQKGKDFWAAFFLALGILAKIYGVVGILFFLFSKNKIKFTGSFLFWLAVLFVLPMLISSPAFIIQTYKDWMNTIAEKNLLNMVHTEVNMQDLSVMGIIRRTGISSEISNLFVLVPAVVLLGLPLLRLNLYSNLVYQLYYLGLALISVVIFSSGAESATYVIATVGVAIWFVLNMHRATAYEIAALVFVLIVTSLSSTDLVPQIIKHNIIRTYALKALPCLVVWLMIIYNVGFKKEATLQSPNVVPSSDNSLAPGNSNR
ncbi:glycosyltransferase family 87 protein [Segetibacter aerophilus]|uniref:Membrane protein n=1 Tax=Segetibacter aerophilus TaxID=670293 RepID=A0A512BEW9_9BACT|nr:glycosyltransferase family 87 protein [Segetibacter aerophilus]GEO10498.1 membrane protein [Segetibacter aerophilus]